MYLYIYDTLVSQQKYAPVLSAIERRVTDLDIKGRIARLTILKNVKEVVTDAVKNGVTTVVAVGDDQTFTKIINVVAPLDVTLGFIPVNKDSTIARALGIPPNELACDVLAARIIRKLDLGKINNQYFLNTAEITDGNVIISIDGYTIESTAEQQAVRFCNIGWHQGSKRVSNPTDGILEAVITPTVRRWLGKKTLASTVFPFTSISLRAVNDPASILIDEQVILKTPARVDVAPSQLKVVVGSNRVFE